MKKLAIALLALVVTAGFAFANGQTESSSSTSSSAKQINLRAIWWGSQQRHERTIKVLNMYSQLHPNVHFDYEYSAWQDYWTKVTTMAAGNNLPDIMQQDYAYITDWSKRGLIIPLDSYIKSGTIDFTNVADASVSGGRVNGQMYGIDLGTNSLCILIDADDFQKAGLALPAKNWSWDDFYHDAEVLHQKLGIWGVSYNVDDPDYWMMQIMGNGETMFNKTGTDLGYPASDDYILVNYMKEIKKLNDEGVTPPYSDSISFRSQGVESDAIVPNKAAMTLVWSNQVVAVWTAAGIDKRHFVIMPIPRLKPDIVPNYIKDSQFFSITKDSKNPEEAAKVINYFTNDIDANKVLLAERGVPVSSKVRDALKPLLDKPSQDVFDFIGFISPIASPTPPPDPTGANEIELPTGIYRTQVLDPFMFGKISAEDAVKTLRTLSEKALQQGS